MASDTPRFDPDYKNADFALYRYPPTVPGAIVVCILFLISALLHTYQIFRTKTWFMTAFAIGCYCSSLYPLSLASDTYSPHKHHYLTVS